MESGSKIMYSSSVLKTVNGKANYTTEYRCLVCEKTFQKFIIFEGHFTFNAKCRAKYGWLMQCYVCGEIFRHLAELKYHLQKHNVTKPPIEQNANQHEESIHGFKCKICQRRFRTKFYLNEHMTIHSKPQTTKSFQRNGDTPSKDILHQAASPFQCQICKVHCKDKIGLERHLTNHKQDKLSCEQCNLCFTTEVSLSSHRQLFHFNGTPKILTENQSNQQLRNVPSKILKENQPNQSQNECKNCTATTNGTKISLPENHLSNEKEKDREHDDSSRNGEEIGIAQKSKEEKLSEHRCKFCKKLCYSHRNLKKHETIHRGAFKCKICNIRFTLNALRWHQSNFHQSLPTKLPTTLPTTLPTKKPSGFPCDLCKFVGESKNRIELHKKVHLGPFKCKICKIPFTKNGLVSHEVWYHPELRRENADVKTRRRLICQRILRQRIISKEPQNGDKTGNMRKLQLHECKACKRIFRSSCDLRRHEAIHRGAFTCKACNIRFTLMGLRTHQKHCKLFLQNESPSPSKVCKVCKLKCSSHERLLLHETVHTTGEYKCTICRITFTKVSLVAHEIRCHPHLRRGNKTVIRRPERKSSPKQDKDKDKGGDKSNDKDKGKGEDKIEDKSKDKDKGKGEDKNEDKSKDKNKVKGENKAKEFPCNICPKIYNHRHHLERHKGYHGAHKCKGCNIPYSLNYIRWHEKRCISVMRIAVTFKCKVCKIRCGSQMSLERHMKVHNPGEYKCAICQKKFTRMAFASHKIRCKRDEPSIKTPEPIIEKEIVFQRNNCDESFSQISNLQTHVKSHTTRRYSCKICNKMFNDKTNLKPHTDRHRFECYVCKKDFSSLKYVISHTRRHVVIKQWVDPLNVYLSNWSPEKSREILQNQPLVLVENLNINSINLASLADFGRAKQTCLEDMEIGIDPMNIATTEVPHNTEEIFLTEVPPIVEESTQVTNCQKNSELPKIIKIETLPTHTEVKKERLNPLKDNCIVYIPPDNEDLLETSTLKQEPDTTANVAQNFGDGPIEVSSESDDDTIDELELFHCYFCNRTFRSLSGLGIHSKTCDWAAM